MAVTRGRRFRLAMKTRPGALVHLSPDPGHPTSRSWKRLRPPSSEGEGGEVGVPRSEGTGVGVPAGQSSRRDQCTGTGPFKFAACVCGVRVWTDMHVRHSVRTTTTTTTTSPPPPPPPPPLPLSPATPTHPPTHTHTHTHTQPNPTPLHLPPHPTPPHHTTHRLARLVKLSVPHTPPPPPPPPPVCANFVVLCVAQ